MNITVSKQFYDLIDSLNDEEFNLLEESVLRFGVKDPLVIWQNGRNYFIDGHQQYSRTM